MIKKLRVQAILEPHHPTQSLQSPETISIRFRFDFDVDSKKSFLLFPKKAYSAAVLNS